MSNFRKRLVDLTDRFASTIDAVHDADAQYDFVMNNDPDYVAGYIRAEADLRKVYLKPGQKVPKGRKTGTSKDGRQYYETQSKQSTLFSNRSAVAKNPTPETVNGSKRFKSYEDKSPSKAAEEERYKRDLDENMKHMAIMGAIFKTRLPGDSRITESRKEKISRDRRETGTVSVSSRHIMIDSDNKGQKIITSGPLSGYNVIGKEYPSFNEADIAASDQGYDEYSGRRIFKYANPMNGDIGYGIAINKKEKGIRRAGLSD